MAYVLTPAERDALRLILLRDGRHMVAIQVIKEHDYSKEDSLNYGYYRKRVNPVPLADTSSVVVGFRQPVQLVESTVLSGGNVTHYVEFVPALIALFCVAGAGSSPVVDIPLDSVALEFTVPAQVATTYQDSITDAKALGPRFGMRRMSTFDTSWASGDTTSDAQLYRIRSAIETTNADLNTGLVKTNSTLASIDAKTGLSGGAVNNIDRTVPR